MLIIRVKAHLLLIVGNKIVTKIPQLYHNHSETTEYTKANNSLNYLPLIYFYLSFVSPSLFFNEVANTRLNYFE